MIVQLAPGWPTHVQDTVLGPLEGLQQQLSKLIEAHSQHAASMHHLRSQRDILHNI